MIFSGHQPNFVPYMGFFYKMSKSDIFVLDDDVQYSRDGLHNANFLKVGGERHKILVPVSIKFGEAINQAKICRERNWDDKMLATIRMNYGKADCFDVGYEFIERYLKAGYESLCDMNVDMIKEIAERFGIRTKIVIASKDAPTELTNNARNVYQCLHFRCDVYYSGVGGKAYNDEEMYRKNGIIVQYSDFEPHEYKQVGRQFVPNLSVLDYVMNNGFFLPKNW